MRRDDAEILKIFKFELKFLEDGGYHRSRARWRASYVFEDSPTCINFDQATRPHPCSNCSLIEFVPPRFRNQSAPCRFISLNDVGQTVDDFYRCGTQIELEDALACWLRTQVQQILRNPTPEGSSSGGQRRENGKVG